jgi:benzoyl-CoA reductase subunit D
MTISIGIDIGSGVVKTTSLLVDRERQQRVARAARRAHPPARQHATGESGLRRGVGEAGLKPADVDYVATTGEGEKVRCHRAFLLHDHACPRRDFFNPRRAAWWTSALNGRAIYVDERGKVLAYKMTSQCAARRS